MLIGVISDTHDNISSIKEAVKFFNLRGVNLVLHCGDIFSPFAAEEFSALNCGFKAIFGNNDIFQAELENIISDFGIIRNAPFEFIIDGKKFIMFHRLLTVVDGKYDYVLYGHTHKPWIENIKDTVYLNAGEACGYRYGRRTAALIDLDSNHCEIFDL
ncbi:MAG: metallophosphoesterase [Endomicrobia bacterium]|nr:metallophosphoesterase [Endomicrobiia bacterium]MCL2799260.1 metallophosphoesterase [Endomicrobiia bacterium]